MKLTFLDAHLQWIPEYPLSAVALKVRIDSSDVLYEGGWGSDDQVVHFQKEIHLRNDVYVGGQFSFHVDLVALLNVTGSEYRTIGSGICTIFAEDTNERTRMIALVNTKMNMIMAQLLVRITPDGVSATSGDELHGLADGLPILQATDTVLKGKITIAEKEKSVSFTQSRVDFKAPHSKMRTRKKRDPLPNNAAIDPIQLAGRDSTMIDIPLGKVLHGNDLAKYLLSYETAEETNKEQGAVFVADKVLNLNHGRAEDVRNAAVGVEGEANPVLQNHVKNVYQSDNVEMNPYVSGLIRSSGVKNEDFKLSVKDVKKASRKLRDETLHAMQNISDRVLRNDLQSRDILSTEKKTFKTFYSIPADPLELGSSSDSDSSTDADTDPDSGAETLRKNKDVKTLKSDSRGKYLKNDNNLNISQQLKVNEACMRVKAVIKKNEVSNENLIALSSENKNIRSKERSPKKVPNEWKMINIKHSSKLEPYKKSRNRSINNNNDNNDEMKNTEGGSYGAVDPLRKILPQGDANRNLLKKKSVNASFIRTTNVHESDQMNKKLNHDHEFADADREDPIFAMQNRLRAAENRRTKILQNAQEKARQIALKDTIKSEAIKRAILLSSHEFNRLRNKFDKKNNILDKEQLALEAKLRSSRGRKNARTYNTSSSQEVLGSIKRSRSFDAVPMTSSPSRNTYRDTNTSRGGGPIAQRGYDRLSVTALPFSNLRLRSQSLGREKAADMEVRSLRCNDVTSQYAEAGNAEHYSQPVTEHSSRRTQDKNYQQNKPPCDPLGGTSSDFPVKSGISKTFNRIKEAASDHFREYAVDLTGHHNQNLLITLVLDRVEAIKSKIPTSSKEDVKNMLMMIERLVTLAIALNAIVKIETAANGNMKNKSNDFANNDRAAMDTCDVKAPSLQPIKTLVKPIPDPIPAVMENMENISHPTVLHRDLKQSILESGAVRYSTFSKMATANAVAELVPRNLDSVIPGNECRDVVGDNADDYSSSSESSFDSLCSSSSVSSADSLDVENEKLSYSERKSSGSQAVTSSHRVQDRVAVEEDSSASESEAHNKDENVVMEAEGNGMGKVDVWSSSSTSNNGFSKSTSSTSSTGSTGSTVSSVDLQIEKSVLARLSIDVARIQSPVIHHYHHSPSPTRRTEQFAVSVKHKADKLIELPQKKSILSSGRRIDGDGDVVASIGSGTVSGTGSGSGDVSSDIALVSRAIDNLQVRTYVPLVFLLLITYVC